MSVVVISETDQGPPPPPPPIYAGKTQGSKVVVGAQLHLTFRYDGKVTPRCEQQGAVLWLRHGTGPWFKGFVVPHAFVDDGSGYVRLAVEPLLDPTAILVQPRYDEWAQPVELRVHDTASPALVAPLA